MIMNADTKEPRKDQKKEGRKDDARKPEGGEEDGATRALSAIAGALARARDSNDPAVAGKPDLDEPRHTRPPLVAGPADAAAQAMSAIARKHAMTGETMTPASAPALRGAGPATRKRLLYDRLVEAEDDLVGLIAYALYKQHKRDWLAAFSTDTGRQPRDEEVHAFMLGEGTDKQLRGYRAQAAVVLRSYTDSVVAEERPQAIVEAVEGRIKASLRWWKFIPASIAAAVLVLGALAALAYVLPMLGVDPGFSLTLNATALR
jgi:hypothetical protein